MAGGIVLQDDDFHTGVQDIIGKWAKPWIIKNS